MTVQRPMHDSTVVRSTHPTTVKVEVTVKTEDEKDEKTKKESKPKSKRSLLTETLSSGLNALKR